MPTNDPGVARALQTVRKYSELLASAIADAEQALAGDPPAQPTATVAEMTVGGWMQRPGSPRWLPIAAVTECAGTPGCWRIDFDLKTGDRDGTFVHVDELDSFPFLTAEQFDRDCAREQEDAFPMARLVQDQAVMDAQAQRELQAERAKDFGHDDPAAA